MAKEAFDDDQLAVDWHRLHLKQLDLRKSIEENKDPQRHAALTAELEAARQGIIQIERQRNQAQVETAGESGATESARIGSWFARPGAGASAPDHTAGSQIGDVDELLTSLGVDPTQKDRQSIESESGRSLKIPISLLSATVAGAAGMAVLIALGAVIWFVASNQSDETATDAGAPAAPAVAEASTEADESGPGTTDAVTAPTSTEPGDGETAQAQFAGSAARDAALQTEIDRITAATPLIFATGSSKLSELQLRILNNVSSALMAYPDLPVTIVGFTDADGDDETNRQLSLVRAEAVKNYLVTRGLPEARLSTEARGEESASGSTVLAGLERRVQFEVGTSGVDPVAPNNRPLRIAVVAPSARDDLAFTQSMVDAVNVIASERGNVEVALTDNTFVPDEAAAAIRNYADQDYDLIIAHGVEFGNALLEIVRDHPDVTFAWGTATDTFGLPNLYAYDAAAEEGGFVMGAMSTHLSSSNTVGVIGPIEVGDAERYVNGFVAGARSEAQSSNVLVRYTGSFSDIALAAEFAEEHVEAGADVLTGSAEMVVGAISVANENGVLWFGTQARQDSLAPEVVVASQVYHWEVTLRPIVTDIDAGIKNGQAYVAQLNNGGLVIEYNPQYQLPADVRQRADRLTNDIISGAVTVPTGR